MSVKYASGRTLATTPLVGGGAFPPNLDPAPLRGSWVIASDGTMAYSDGSQWYASAPKGSEMLIPPWVAVPEGWFEVDVALSGALANRKVISNKFNINYVLSDAETWAIVTPSAMYTDAAGTTPVISSPEPVGLLEDSTTPQLDWYQDVSVDRPTWVQKTRTVDGVAKTINALQFDGLGQQLKVDFPATVTGSMVHFTSSGPYILGVEIPAGTYGSGSHHIWDIEEIILFDRFLTSGETENLIAQIGKQRDRPTEPDFGTDWINAFRDRPEIRSMPSFDFTGVTDMQQAFQNSAAEEWLSGGFLGTAGDVESFSGTFSLNNINSIPDGLFDNTPNVRSYEYIFDNAQGGNNTFSTVPSGLFNGSNGPVRMQGMFRENVNLTSIPGDLFANIDAIQGGYSGIRNCFLQCSLSSLPEYLFSYSTGTVDMEKTFLGNNFTSLPDNFLNNALCEFVSFESAFDDCDLTTIPAGFFDAHPNVTNFSRTFNSNSLTSAPANLFDTQTIATNYEQCFHNNDLDAASVDNILVSIQASADANSLDNGIIGIDGGTNATPTTTGQNAADALRARGWTVNLNGY